jgi:ABC-type iron transport system FetAB ATPase subunit
MTKPFVDALADEVNTAKKATTKGSSASTDLLRVSGLLTVGLLQPVDLTIQSGQVWMLSGISGTGKSQLLKAIADLIPHSGQAWLNGQAQDSICPEIWRGQVMYFAAETAWWLDTIAEHFAEAPNTETLAALGLDKSILQQNPDSCSSGEKQRLALLRGLSYHPKILLLDEISANLDEASTLKVEAFLQHYIQAVDPARAILWISHDVRQCDRLARSELQWVLSP